MDRKEEILNDKLGADIFPPDIKKRVFEAMQQYAEEYAIKYEDWKSKRELSYYDTVTMGGVSHNVWITVNGIKYTDAQLIEQFNNQTITIKL